MSSSGVTTAEVTGGGRPSAVCAGSRLRVRSVVSGLRVRHLGRVQHVLAVRAQLDVRWGTGVEGGLRKAEGGCEDNHRLHD